LRPNWGVCWKNYAYAGGRRWRWGEMRHKNRSAAGFLGSARSRKFAWKKKSASEISDIQKAMTYRGPRTWRVKATRPGKYE